MTLRRRFGRLYTGVGVVSVGLFGVVAVAGVQFVHRGDDVVYRWDPATARTQQLLTDFVEQDAALRGYALSRDGDFLAVYRQARTQQAHDLDRLRTLVGAEDDLASKVERLSSTSGRWQREVADPAVAAVKSGDPVSAGRVVGARDRRLSNAARASGADLLHAVTRKAEDARQARRDYLIVFVIALAFTAVTLVVAGFLFWRGLRRWVLVPIDRLGGETRQVAGGDTYRQITVEGPVEFTDLGHDVEAMRLQIAGQLARAQEIQEELRIQGEELARSNDDLQQFAYVASHDLSEPLRKVANFCQLLERQYGPELDDRARQYIDFAVDGAKRMQRLITDLLALSRVGRTTEQFVAVDLDAALDDALATLADPIGQAGANIERLTKLPVVPGDQSLLTSLLENLVGNAVKYRREDVPLVVRIGAEEGDDQWTITVEDNGIGIDPQYAERIFVVFQRLHLRDKYGGTGIGLALCRKIVEFHGGRIWLVERDVESEPGATFRFTMPIGDTEGRAASAEPRD